MAVIMKRITGAAVILSMIFGVCSRILDAGIWLSLTITCAAFTYHFAMRLFVGFVFNRTMNNKADYNQKWFQVRPAEIRFYNTIKVKKWKSRMPTYAPELFSPKMHTWDEIAQATCQAELVHETIAVLSFLPILLSVWWGTFWVFLVTSVCAAFVDLSFVIMQRYNRPRVLRLAKTDKREE